MKEELFSQPIRVQFLFYFILTQSQFIIENFI